MMRFLNLLVIAGILGISGCGPSTPNPDYTIQVIPASDGHAAVAIPPNCPRWSDNDIDFFDNQPLPQFGCADARNLAVMVERPEDLLQGRELSPASGVLASGATTRYYNNQTRGFIYTSQQPDNSVDITTASTPSSSLTGETPASSGGSSASK